MEALHGVSGIRTGVRTSGDFVYIHSDANHFDDYAMVHKAEVPSLIAWLRREFPQHFEAPAAPGASARNDLTITVAIEGGAARAMERIRGRGNW